MHVAATLFCCFGLGVVVKVEILYRWKVRLLCKLKWYGICSKAWLDCRFCDWVPRYCAYHLVFWSCWFLVWIVGNWLVPPMMELLIESIPGEQPVEHWSRTGKWSHAECLCTCVDSRNQRRCDGLGPRSAASHTWLDLICGVPRSAGMQLQCYLQCIAAYLNVLSIWGFREIGVPPNHPLSWDFPL